MKNTLLQWILQNILENQTFQRIAKIIIADFYAVNFMKGIVISVKVDEMFNVLKSASHCLLVEIWDGMDDQSFFGGHIRIPLLCLSFNKGQT